MGILGISKTNFGPKIYFEKREFQNFQNLETIWDSRNIYKISRFPNRFEILKILNFENFFSKLKKKNSKFRINLDLDHHIWKRNKKHETHSSHGHVYDHN